MHRRYLPRLAPLALCVTLNACKAPTEGPARGEMLYGYCSQCHGQDGAGDKDFKAPAIAGLPEWYVANTLRKFRDGARGDHPDDVDGLRMRPMARTLASDADLQTVAAYVAAMTPANPAPALQGGDATKGKNLFAPCTACHGADAKGNQALNAPPLNQASDWYLKSSIEKFKAGIRGTDPKDTTGAQMRPMSMILTSEQDIADVVAYIATL